MPAASVIGGSPVSVLVGGRQVSIPLSLLAIKNGVVDTSRLDPAVATAAAPVLASRLASGAIAASKSTAPVVALKLKAKAAGAAGNKISVKFTGIVAKTPAGDSTANVEVSYEDRRPGLTAATIGTELGFPGTPGSKPGLVTLTAAATVLPAATTATPLGGSPLQLAILKNTGSGNAFTLEAAAPGTDPLLADVTVAIEDVDAGPGTFTLVIALKHPESNLKLDLIDSTFGLLLDVVDGPDAAPASGTVKLTGGGDSEMSVPKAAEATILSD